MDAISHTNIRPAPWPHPLSSFCQNIRSLVQKIANCVSTFFRQVKNFLLPSPSIRLDPVACELAQMSRSVAGKINGVYITSNEKDSGKIFDRLQTDLHPGSKRRIHIGCASWHNFDIAAQTNPQYVLIFDFNPQNQKFIEKTVELIRSNATRALFVQAVVNYLDATKGDERQAYFHWDQQALPTERIQKELRRMHSWLSSDASYDRIRQLVQTGRIVAITEDIRHTEGFSQMRKCLEKHWIDVETVYLSNIPRFMNSGADRRAYLASLRALLSPDSLVIDCPDRDLRQVAHWGRDFLTQ